MELKPDEMIEHLDKQNGNCPKQQVECLYTPNGCHSSIGFDEYEEPQRDGLENTTRKAFGFQPKRLLRENLERHMETNKYEHGILLRKPAITHSDEEEQILKDRKEHSYYSLISKLDKQELLKKCAELINKNEQSYLNETKQIGSFPNDIIQNQTVEQIYSTLLGMNMNEKKIKHLATSLMHENIKLMENCVLRQKHLFDLGKGNPIQKSNIPGQKRKRDQL